MDGPQSERLTTPEFIEALTTTLANARSEGEPYQSLAEKHLGPLEKILHKIADERREIIATILRLQSNLEELERQTNVAVQNYADRIWEMLGCPDYDPLYNILFPPSSPKPQTFQTNADELSLLAELLKSHVHPGIEPAQANMIANELEAFVTQYDELLYPFSQQKSRQSTLDALEASVARAGLLELSALRRALRALGLDDSRIKSVVPPPVPSSRGLTNRSKG